MDRNDIALRAECYAGHRGEEIPRRFHLGARAVDVVDVLDCWLSPGHRYFKVSGNDRANYILRHDVATDRRELTVFGRTRLNSAVSPHLQIGIL